MLLQYTQTSLNCGSKMFVDEVGNIFTVNARLQEFKNFKTFCLADLVPIIQCK